MTTTLDPPTHSTTSPAQRLRFTTTAVRVSMRWLCVRKSLTPEQKNQTFPDATTANKHAEKKIAEKVKKGYAEVN